REIVAAVVHAAVITGLDGERRGAEGKCRGLVRQRAGHGYGRERREQRRVGDAGDLVLGDTLTDFVGGVGAERSYPTGDRDLGGGGILVRSWRVVRGEGGGVVHRQHHHRRRRCGLGDARVGVAGGSRRLDGCRAVEI